VRGSPLQNAWFRLIQLPPLCLLTPVVMST
jgi:hypothetical protein